MMAKVVQPLATSVLEQAYEASPSYYSIQFGAFETRETYSLWLECGNSRAKVNLTGSERRLVRNPLLVSETLTYAPILLL